MNIIRFTVEHEPIAQPRQRHRVVRAGKRVYVQNYTPSDHPVNAFKRAVRSAAKEAYHGSPLTGPVAVNLTLVFPRPDRLRWKKRPMPSVYHTGRPDAENVGKAVLDALTKHLYKDDAQVCSLTIQKWVASGDESPHIRVTIHEAAL